MTGATSGAGTAPDFNPGFQFWLNIWVFLCRVLQITVCCFVIFFFAIVLSVLLRFTASGYTFGILDLRLLVTPLVSQIYGFWLHLWYLLAIVLSVLLRFTASGYTFSIFWPLFFLFFFDLRFLVTPLVSSNFSYVCEKNKFNEKFVV